MATRHRIWEGGPSLDDGRPERLRRAGGSLGRVVGLWVYQTLGQLPDPDAVAAKAQRHGLRWISAQATEGRKVLDRDWIRGMRRATKERGVRLGVHGFVGRPRPEPVDEAEAMARAIDLARPDFAIVNAEIQYEESPAPDSRAFVRAYRRRKPAFPSFLSSFGRPEFHPMLDWAAWADGGFRGMPQAYETLLADAARKRSATRRFAGRPILPRERLAG